MSDSINYTFMTDESKDDLLKEEEPEFSYDIDETYSDIFDTPSTSSSSCGRLSQCQSLNGTGSNKSFNSNRLREIERDNSILMTKISSKSKRPKQYKTHQVPQIRSSFEINKRRNQTKIDYENKILLKKIQGVKSSVRN